MLGKMWASCTTKLFTLIHRSFCKCEAQMPNVVGISWGLQKKLVDCMKQTVSFGCGTRARLFPALGHHETWGTARILVNIPYY